MQKQPNKKTFKGFTLVELIIVITILAILGTIAYISFQGFTKDARDSSRMSDIKQLYNGISIYKTQTEKTPMPDSYVNILSGTTTISYQGYAGASVLRTLKITGGKDPGTKDYYIYSTDVNQKKGQLMTFMETSDKDVQLLGRLKDLNIITQAQATNTGYYQDKKIYVYGDKIGILTDSNKVPLQETTTNTGIDITTLTGNITTYFGGNVYSGGLSTSTGLTLINQINGAISNTLPCSSTTYNGYNITSLQDKQAQTFTKTGAITNGTQTGSILATCNNGTLSYSSENLQTSCIFGYSWNGSSCIALYMDTTNSLRFDSGRNTYLQKANSNGDQKKFTLSFWYKPTKFGKFNSIFSSNPYSNQWGFFVGLLGTNQLYFGNDSTASSIGKYWAIKTINTYTDSSKWMHILVSIDTVNNNTNLYVDGTQITSFAGTSIYPDVNQVNDIFRSSTNAFIGAARVGTDAIMDGYLSEVNVIDGQALGPSDFGVNVGGKRLPKSYTGTYGTNGFHLNFSNSGNLGDDVAGTNDWTLQNYSTPANDQMIDSPTNNFATLNPLLASTNFTYTNGNLSLVGNGVGQYASWSTLSMSGSNWYWEVKCDVDPASNRLMIGFTDGTITPASLRGSSVQYAYMNDGSTYNGSSLVGTNSGYTVGDTIGLKFNGSTLSFYKNNVLQSYSIGGLSGKTLFPMIQKNSGISTNAGVTINFGQGGQSGLSWCSGAGGYFKDCPPAGFKALSSKNIGN